MYFCLYASRNPVKNETKIGNQIWFFHYILECDSYDEAKTYAKENNLASYRNAVLNNEEVKEAIKLVPLININTKFYIGSGTGGANVKTLAGDKNWSATHIIISDSEYLAQGECIKLKIPIMLSTTACPSQDMSKFKVINLLEKKPEEIKYLRFIWLDENGNEINQDICQTLAYSSKTEKVPLVNKTTKSFYLFKEEKEPVSIFVSDCGQEIGFNWKVDSSNSLDEAWQIATKQSKNPKKLVCLGVFNEDVPF